LPPRHVPEILPRPRLIEKLKSNLNAPVTLVTADAGCGKTTLVAEFLRRQSRQTVWYQFDLPMPIRSFFSATSVTASSGSRRTSAKL